jgi:hypothetical protein
LIEEKIEKMSLLIRKWSVSMEVLCAEAGQRLEEPVRKVVAAAVLVNPFAGAYVEDLGPLVAAGESLGEMLARRAVDALGGGRAPVSYGKAAIVGVRGELEHGAAILHPKFGKPVRAAIGQGAAVMPSVTKRAGPGATVDVPLHCKDDEWSFDHFDAVSFSISDAPADDEILIAVALADKGRPLARVRRL